MSRLRRLVLVRHGETDGDSSIRFHGSNDVDLSDVGRQQMVRVARAFRNEAFDRVVASPLRRSWRSAVIASRGGSVQLESDLREIHFGRWEGLTREEIQASDPILYADWQSGAEGFEYPGGEKRGEFQTRVKGSLARIEASGVGSALLVVHKGVIRVLAQEILGEDLERDEPALGGSLELTRAGDGSWFRGRRSSNPESLDAAIVTAL